MIVHSWREKFFFEVQQTLQSLNHFRSLSPFAQLTTRAVESPLLKSHCSTLQHDWWLWGKNIRSSSLLKTCYLPLQFHSAPFFGGFMPQTLKLPFFDSAFLAPRLFTGLVQERERETSPSNPPSLPRYKTCTIKDLSWRIYSPGLYLRLSVLIWSEGLSPRFGGDRGCGKGTRRLHWRVHRGWGGGFWITLLHCFCS